MLAQHWWVWLGRPRWIQISTKFTILKHNVSLVPNVKRREEFHTGRKQSPKSRGRHVSLHYEKLPLMSYRHSAAQKCHRSHWQMRFCGSTSSPQRDPTAPCEAKRLIEAHLALNSTAPPESHRCGLFPGQTGAENVHSPVPGSPEHFSNSVWEAAQDCSQVAMRRPPGWCDLTGWMLPPSHIGRPANRSAGRSAAGTI